MCLHRAAMYLVVQSSKDGRSDALDMSSMIIAHSASCCIGPNQGRSFLHVERRHCLVHHLMQLGFLAIRVLLENLQTKELIGKVISKRWIEVEKTFSISTLDWRNLKRLCDREVLREAVTKQHMIDLQALTQICLVWLVTISVNAPTSLSRHDLRIIAMRSIRLSHRCCAHILSSRWLCGCRAIPRGSFNFGDGTG